MNTVFILHLNIYSLYQISEFAFHFTLGKSFTEKQYDVERKSEILCWRVQSNIHVSYHLKIALQNKFKSDTKHILLHVLAFFFTHQSMCQATRHYK